MTSVTESQAQLASTFNPERIVWPCVIEPKLDGIRAAWVHGVGYRSREGNPLIGPTFEGPLDYVLDGELVGEDFQSTCSAVRVGGSLRFVVFDAIPLAEWTASAFVLSLARRLAVRDADLRPYWTETVFPVHTTRVFSPRELYCHHKQFVEAGYEGSMVKALAVPYTPGRSSAWMKLKPLDDLDVRVIGVEPGRGRYLGQLGSLICELDSGVRVKIGVGMSLEDRRRWMTARVIGRLCEITYQGLTCAGVPRFARFKRWRSDRYAAARRVGNAETVVTDPDPEQTLSMRQLLEDLVSPVRKLQTSAKTKLRNKTWRDRAGVWRQRDGSTSTTESEGSCEQERTVSDEGENDDRGRQS